MENEHLLPRLAKAYDEAVNGRHWDLTGRNDYLKGVLDTAKAVLGTDDDYEVELALEAAYEDEEE